jgi:hypothetical protein
LQKNRYHQQVAFMNYSIGLGLTVLHAGIPPTFERRYLISLACLVNQEFGKIYTHPFFLAMVEMNLFNVSYG